MNETAHQPPEKTDTEADLHNEQEEELESLLQWQFTEEKVKNTKDKDLLIAILGGTVAILAILAKTYIFSLLLVLATITLIRIRRRKEKTLLFNVTTIGLFMDDDFIEIENIKAFNIIDDPGETARLILKVERIIHINEIIPIYDTNIETINQTFRKLNIPRENDLQPTIVDNLTAKLF